MSEWWTYRLSDFLLFSPRTYHRLFELYNAAIWPAQLAALAVGIAILLLLHRPGSGRGRIVAGLLALAWVFVAIAFHLHRYATVNWAAPWFAAGFALEAALLLGIGLAGGLLGSSPVRGPAAVTGVALALFGVLLQPLIGPALGRPWTQIELFGLAPDPTAVATLGILLVVASGGARWALLAIPIAWCLVGGATLWAMDAAEAPVLPLAAAITIAAALWSKTTQ